MSKKLGSLERTALMLIAIVLILLAITIITNMNYTTGDNELNKLVKNCDMQTGTTYLTVMVYKINDSTNSYEYTVIDTDGEIVKLSKDNLVPEGPIEIGDVIQAEFIKYTDRNTNKLVLTQYKGIKANTWTPGPTELPRSTNSSKAADGSPTLR